MKHETMLCLTNSYLTEFEALVQSCTPCSTGYEIVLDKTAFFAEGGGQPCDKGVLGDTNVLDVQQNGDIVIHYTDAPLEVGHSVSGKIDWARRFDNMQQHTGEHILSGIINSRFGYDNVGFHIGQDFVTVDFNGVLCEHDLDLAESSANAAIAANLDICTYFPSNKQLLNTEYRSKKPLSGEIRLIGIQGVDLCACCGTHVNKSGEVQLIKIISSQNYKGGTRLNIVCGMRAVCDYNARCKTTAAISASLSTPVQDIHKAVIHLQNDLNCAKGDLFAAMQQLYVYWAKEATGDMPTVIKPNLNADALRRLCLIMCDEYPDKICIAFSQNTDKSYFYALASKNIDVRPLAKQLNVQCNGRGGGTANLCCGSIADFKQDI